MQICLSDTVQQAAKHIARKANEMDLISLEISEKTESDYAKIITECTN